MPSTSCPICGLLLCKPHILDHEWTCKYVTADMHLRRRKGHKISPVCGGWLLDTQQSCLHALPGAACNTDTQEQGRLTEEGDGGRGDGKAEHVAGEEREGPGGQRVMKEVQANDSLAAVTGETGGTGLGMGDDMVKVDHSTRHHY